LQYSSTGDFTGSLLSPDYTVAQVIYNYSIVYLSYPHDTLPTCSCYLCGTLYIVYCQNYTCMRQVKKINVIKTYRFIINAWKIFHLIET
jgi:hypothetical protein